MKKLFVVILFLGVVSAVFGSEYHVSVAGNDGNDGSAAKPFKTISAAANVAQAGDVVTVHEGVYRERVCPPRGGESDARRIVYQAAPGEKVVITGSEVIKGWEKVGGDTWKVVLPNKFFGDFNPYSDRIRGDWFVPQGRQHHTGAVYLNGDWLIESAHLNDVLTPAGNRPLWFARVDGDEDADYLLSIAALTVGPQRIAATSFAAKNGELQKAKCSEGGKCMRWIRTGHWLKYDKVDFGAGAEKIEFRAASATGGGDVEVRLDGPDGELLGRCTVADTGDWEKWATFTATIKPTDGEKSICLVFRSNVKTDTRNTTIWARFPGVNPNDENVEINVRRTVFTPEKTGINYITVRGFTLRNAATPWAPPTAGQIGLVSAYWCKGWIIENNDIAYSRCSGVALGKYSDEWDNRAESPEGYVGTLTRALSNGWNKATVGGHIVRNNHIHHCEQAGVVGSLGCSFSTVTGNDIHDIHVQALFSGAEMAGIKFHGAIDVVISGNHIYRCGDAAGLWLDWMAQGTHVIGNFFHDNATRDIFCEVNHGPYLIANNLLLSKSSHLANSQGGAYAHNLVAGGIQIHYDSRRTPYHKAHSTEVVDLHKCPVGDVRWFNNLLVSGCNLDAYNKATWPVAAAGNVFAKGARPSKFEAGALLKPDFDPAIKVVEKPDGWYLEVTLDKAWATEQARKLVTTESLGKATIPDLPFERADGSPLRIETDYFGDKRNVDNPFPGPFEIKEGGRLTLKVWPVVAR